MAGCASEPKPVPLGCLYPRATCVLDAEGELVYVDYLTDPTTERWRLSYGEREVRFEYQGFAPSRDGSPVRLWVKRSKDGHRFEFRYDVGRDGTLEAVMHEERGDAHELISMVLDRGADGRGDERVERDGGDWVLRAADGTVLARVEGRGFGVHHTLSVDVADDGVADGRLDFRFDDDGGTGGVHRSRVASTRRPDGSFDSVRWELDARGGVARSEYWRNGTSERTERCAFDPVCRLPLEACEQVCAGRAREAGHAPVLAFTLTRTQSGFCYRGKPITRPATARQAVP